MGAGLVIAMLAVWAPAGVARAASAPTQRYIVTYGAGGLAPLEAAHTAAAVVEQALPDDGSRVERTYATLPAVAVTATAAGKAALEAEPGVTSVTPDIQFRIPDDGAAPSSLAAAAPTALTPVTVRADGGHRRHGRRHLAPVRGRPHERAPAPTARARAVLGPSTTEQLPGRWLDRVRRGGGPAVPGGGV